MVSNCLFVRMYLHFNLNEGSDRKEDKIIEKNTLVLHSTLTLHKYGLEGKHKAVLNNVDFIHLQSDIGAVLLLCIHYIKF